MKLFAHLLYASAITIGLSTPSKMKTCTLAGISAQWHFADNELCMELTSPSKGWIALGLNNQREFVGSNLIMASHNNGKTLIEDQFITELGVHPAVEELGGNSHILEATMQDHDNGKRLILKIQTSPKDNFHYALKSNERIYLTLAYSTSADFNHHSRQRASLWINL